MPLSHCRYSEDAVLIWHDEDDGGSTELEAGLSMDELPDVAHSPAECPEHEGRVRWGTPIDGLSDLDPDVRHDPS
jgi:hypothetical protein